MVPATRLEPLCYGGEELLASETVEGGTVGVTSHRVLVLTPDGPGARFRALDRPNVTGFSSRTTGPKSRRNWGLVALVVGVGLLLAGVTVDGMPRFVGLFVLLVALGLLGWYFWESGWVMEITIAGADSVRVPIIRAEFDVVDRLDADLEDVRVADGAGPTSTATD